MLEFIKKNSYYLVITFVYSLITCLVYGLWTYSAWHLWYVTLIVIIAIIAVGVLICYFWIKSENKKEETIVQ